MAVVLVINYGCASVVAINAGAEKVKIVKYITSEELTKLKDVGFAECDLGMNGRTRSTNQEGCVNN